MDATFAQHFASEWIDAWNGHDLERILPHYADDFEMTSPMVVQLMGEPTGTLRGKTKVGAYWQKALALVPDLKFELLSVLVGVNSVTINYLGLRGRLSAEVFHLDAHNKVIRAFAHYAS
jgi:ketosteroid isomerase-like protein